MPYCKSCNAEITWIKTEGGKNHPVDAKATKRWVNVISLGWLLLDTHESHFATCPNADQHRKSKG